MCNSTAEIRQNMPPVFHQVSGRFPPRCPPRLTRRPTWRKTVLVGSSSWFAYSAFVPLAVYERDRHAFPAEPEKIDVEKLKAHWSTKREAVENSGRPTIILRNGAPCVALVPTKYAFETKIKRARNALDRADDARLDELAKRLARIEKRLLTADEIKKLRRTLTFTESMVAEWRAGKGLSQTLPAVS